MKINHKGITDAEIRASALGTSSVDGAHASLGNTTDAEAAGNGTVIAILKRQRSRLDAILVAITGTLLVSGTISVGNTPSVNQGTPPWAQNITQVAGAALTLGSKTSANSIPVVVASDQGTLTVTQATTSQISIGTSTGKANVLKTGSLTTTAVTADQVVLTYTVTAGKTLYLEYWCVQARLTAVAATASILGAASAETPSGTKVYTATFANPTTSDVPSPSCVTLAEPIPVAATVVVRFVTTPTATTSMLWIASFGGYEK